MQTQMPQATTSASALFEPKESMKATNTGQRDTNSDDANIDAPKKEP